MGQENLILKGKVALVTGGAQGIGFAIAKGMATAGANVAIADINLDGAKEAAKSISSEHSKAIGVLVDVADMKQVERMVKEVMREFDRIDILVNNAGVVVRKTALDTSEEEWDWIMKINLKGPFLCCKAVVPYFIKQNSGRIINIVSAQVGVVEPERGAYIASKTGLLGLTRSLAVELAQYNIRANAIGPGWTKTDMNRQALEGDQERLKYIQGKMPLARLAEPEEIAGLAVYLASDIADYITGQVILIDGGWTVW